MKSAKSHYGSFRDDIINAVLLVVISSPFVSVAGSDRLIRNVSQMNNKEARVILITYSPTHYSESVRERIHRRLLEVGVNVILQESITSRYAIADKETLWHGRMNLVSTVRSDDEMRIVNCAQAESLLEN